jgi:hypothetical protein
VLNAAALQYDYQKMLCQQKEISMDEGAKLKLKSATIAALVGVAYIFIMRAMSTIIPGLFRNLAVVQAVTVTSLLASVAILLFFIVFYGHYVQKEQVGLAGATLLSILGRCGMLLLHIKTLLRVFSIYVLVNFVYSYHFLDRFFPWVSSLFTFIFFYVFYKELTNTRSKQLRGATLLAALMSLVITLMQTFFLLHYLFVRSVVPLANIPQFVTIVSYGILIVNFCAMLFFFVSFYRHIDGEFLSRNSESGLATLITSS